MSEWIANLDCPYCTNQPMWCYYNQLCRGCVDRMFCKPDQQPVPTMHKAALEAK